MNPPLANKSFIWNVLRRGSLLARPLRKQSARFLFGLVLTWRQGNTHSQGRPMPMVELLVFLIGILLIATPIIALILLVRYSKVRSELNRLKEENTRQHTSFQRELTDLKRQLSAVVHPAAPTAEKALERPVVAPSPATTTAQNTGVPSPQVGLPPPVKLPPAVSVPTPPVQPPLPSVPSEPKSVLPAAAKTPAEAKPSAPVVPPPITTPSVPLSQPAAPRIPARKPSAPAQIPPSAARVSAPPPLSAYRVPASRPTLQQRMKTISAIEETLGTNWLNKLGIIILVVGVALFGIYELGALGPLGKVGISYLASAFLLVGGIYLEKNERYRLLGRTGIGGGWALLFFSTFGIYHVEAMRVLSQDPGALTLDCALMLLVAVAMAFHTLRYRSQLFTGLAFLLGYTTVALSQDTVYSLSAGVFLAIGLVSIVLKMCWFELEVFGILSSYLNHLYWLYRILGIEGAQGHHFEQYHASLALLFFYWLTFRISYIARTIKTEFEEHISTLAALLNVLLLLGVMKFQSVQPELAYLALLIIGAFEFVLA